MSQHLLDHERCLSSPKSERETIQKSGKSSPRGWFRSGNSGQLRRVKSTSKQGHESYALVQPEPWVIQILPKSKLYFLYVLKVWHWLMSR
jgi:hypothetical protein